MTKQSIDLRSAVLMKLKRDKSDVFCNKVAKN